MRRPAFSVATVIVLTVCGHGQAHAQFRFGPAVNLGPTINDVSAQFSPSLSANGLEIYYSSGLLWRGNGWEGDADLYVSRRQCEDPADCPWGAPERLTFNSEAWDWGLSISHDGLELYFNTSTEFAAQFQDGRHRFGGRGNGDLWVARRDCQDCGWEEPENLGDVVNSTASDGDPSITDDGTMLFFASKRAGRSEIWVTRRESPEDEWQVPEKLGPTVNGAAAEQPATRDGLTLFFARPPGRTADLWLTRRSCLECPWSPPQRVDELSTRCFEGSPALSPDGSTLYFSGWADAACGGRGGEGAMDLYRVPFESPPSPDFTVTPESGVAPLTVEMDGRLSTAQAGFDIVSYRWDFGDGATDAGETTEHTYNSPGRFSVRLTVADNRGLSWTTSRIVRVGCASEVLASQWISADVGEPLIPGSAGIEGESGQQLLSLCATGRPLSGAEDSFYFVYQEFSGDTTLAAQVVNLNGGRSGAQVGVMLRESLEADARYVAMTLRSTTSSEGFRLNYRDSEGGRSRRTSGPGGVELPNARVRIERQGEELVGSVSIDGSTWEEVDRRMIDGFPEDYYGGFFAAGGESSNGGSFAALQAELRLELPVPPSDTFLRGDSNGDGTVDISDAINTLGTLFVGQGDILCDDAGDANDDGAVDISDAIVTLGVLFLGNGVIPPPGTTECGIDPTFDLIGCDTFEMCP